MLKPKLFDHAQLLLLFTAIGNPAQRHIAPNPVIPC